MLEVPRQDTCLEHVHVSYACNIETDSGINGDQSLGITIVAAQSEVLHEHNAHCIMLNQKHVCTSACTKSTCDMAEYK
jgi:hypothetical protein